MAVIKQADELHQLARRILQAAGSDQRNAGRVADHMISANLSGVDTHGVNQLPFYVESIQQGHIVPDARPRILRETPNTALVSGNWTFGQTTAKDALDIAIEKAISHQVALAGMVQLHHIGRLGEYSEMGAAKGMIVLITASGFSETKPWAVPFGGKQPVLHTNPWSMGFPAGQENPVVFDFATTASSQVKIKNAHRRGESLPEGWIVDREGRPSTDTNDFFDGGAQLPFGGHKGYALMVASEFLGRILTGSHYLADPPHGGVVFGYTGVFLLVFRADVFQEFRDYGASADTMEHRIRAVPPAPGFDQVMLPGEPEARNRRRRRQEGIPLEEHTWDSLMELARSLGMDDPI